MGKSARKKREKKKDFQKVKFKVGKKIQKGNAVDTTFKTKKIVIKEQFKSALNLNEKGPKSGKVRHDVKEILNRIQHYNISMRCSALNTLRETLNDCPDQIDIYLGLIVSRSMEACADRDKSVRNAAYDLLKHLFSNVSGSNMVPFFPIIVAHLRCAMTHIFPAVQSSSLFVVDLLVDNYPNHLAHFSKQLLPDFLSQIANEDSREELITLSSRLETASGVKSNSTKKQKVTNKKTMTLASDPSRDITSVAWHLQVAKRVRKILYNIHVCISKTDYGNDDQRVDSPGKVVIWQAEKPLYVSLHYKGYVMSDMTISANRLQLADFFDSASQMKSLFSSLTRLMCEMWVESSSLDIKLGKNAVSNQSLEIYCCIVDIIRLMFKLVNNWEEDNKELQGDFFDEDFVNRFRDNCMSDFPYDDHTSSENVKHNRKKNVAASGSRTVFSLNLLLCDIYMCLMPSMRKAKSTKQLSWLLDVLHTYETWSLDEAETVINVVRRFFSYKNNETKDLLGAVSSLYKQLPFEHPTRNLLLNLICDVLTLPNLIHIQKNDSLWSWISSLPGEVSKYGAKIPLALLKIFQCVACRGRTDFLSSVQKHLPDILESVHTLNIEDFKVIINLLYWIPHLSRSLFMTISRVCLNPNLGSQKCSYILHLLHNRIHREQHNWNENENAPIYLSLLFSLSFGCSREELLHLNSESLPRVTRQGFVSRIQEEYKILPNEPEELDHQRDVTNIAVSVLNLVPLELELQLMAERFLASILMEYHTLPLSSVQSLFLLVASIWNKAELCQSLHSPLCNLFLSAVEISTGNGDLYKNLLGAARSVLLVPSFSFVVSSALLGLTTKNVNDEVTCNIIGEILNQMVKCTKHLDVKSNDNLRLVLKELEKTNLDRVLTSRWFLSSRYELELCSDIGDHVL